MAKPAKNAGKKKLEKRTARVRMLEGKKVNIVFYDGHHINHGRYFTGEVEGQMVVDNVGKPVPFRNIGALVRV